MDHNRAASYTRVFTDDTLTAGHQAEAIRRLADALGMTIVREYEDEEHGSGPGRNADPLVENGFLEFKQWRGVATRYAKNSLSYLAICQIRAMAIWIKLL